MGVFAPFPEIQIANHDHHATTKPFRGTPREINELQRQKPTGETSKPL
jgi:hypothetical protein